MLDIIKDLRPIIAWLHIHPYWTGLAAFFIAFSESTALLGVIIPGSVIMTAVGSLIGTGVLAPIPIFIAAMLGALGGDILSFWLGYHFKQRLYQIWPLTRYPKIVEQGKVFFKKHGGKSIFLGRFAGPMRAVVPMVAGSMNFPTKRFLIADVLSAIGWAPAYMLPGILLGAASVELAPATAMRFIVIVLAWLLALWCLAWLIKLSLGYMSRLCNLLMEKWWNFMRAHNTLRPITTLLQNPDHPEKHGQLTLGFFTLFCSVLFLILSYSVYTHGMLTDWNGATLHLFSSFRHAQLDKIIVGITFIGEVPVILSILFVVFAWLAYRGRWWAALHWMGNGVLTAGAIWVLKKLIHNPRPFADTIIRPTSSFPSAHVTLTVAIFGFLAALIASELPIKKRFWVYLPVIILAFIIACSRLYLGTHWLTDVIGALLLGSACVMFSTLAYRRKKHEHLVIGGLIISTGFALIIGWSAYFNFEYTTQLHNYTPHWTQTTISPQQWWQQQKPLLPLYQKTRLGHPQSLINLQIYGPVQQLVKRLQKQGWQLQPSLSIFTEINRIAKKQAHPRLPFLSQVVKGYRPSFILLKRNGKEKLLVLRLWKTHSNLSAKLYIGSLQYQIPKHHWLIKHDVKSIGPQNTVIEQFSKQLTRYTQRMVNYPSIRHLASNHGETRANILLLKA